MENIEKAAEILNKLAEKNPEATKELGKTAVTLTKAINMALLPVSTLVWGYDKIAEYINRKISEKLKDVPIENITTPPINIAGPIIEAMRFTGNNELREMFANLLAASMNCETADYIHPRFIEVIKNLTRDEAKMLKFIAENFGPIPFIRISGANDQIRFYDTTIYTEEFDDLDVSTDNINLYIDNLVTLGILTFEDLTNLRSRILINDLKRTNRIKNAISEYSKKYNIKKSNMSYNTGVLNITEFGDSFISFVVK